VIDSTRADLRRQGTEQPPARPVLPGRAGKRGKYLPSAQVVEELVSLGPDLSTIAAELRNRLTESDLTRGCECHRMSCGMAHTGVAYPPADFIRERGAPGQT
jgi:hypothetical protein